MVSNTIKFNNWTEAEIRAHIAWLQHASPLTLRAGNKAIELRDGLIRVATLGEDKKWSDWEDLEAPDLHVNGGKLVMASDDGKLLPRIRVSANDAYELCKTSAAAWENNINDVFNYGGGESVIDEILNGDEYASARLTIRTIAPGSVLQTDLKSKLIWEGKLRVKDNREMNEAADRLYQTNEWLNYYPYSENHQYWVPAQEIAFLQARLAQSKPVYDGAAAPTRQTSHSITNTTLSDILLELKKLFTEASVKVTGFVQKLLSRK